MTREKNPGPEATDHLVQRPKLDARDVRAGRDANISQVINYITIQQYKESKRKQWRELELAVYPTWDLERDLSANYSVHLIVALHRVFANRGYTTFTSEIAIEDRKNEEGEYQAIVLVSHQIKFLGELRGILRSLWDQRFPIEERRAIQEQEKQEALALHRSWQVDVNFLPTKERLPYEFIYDPDGKSITIRPHDSAPISPDDYPEKLQRTSELLMFLNVLRRPNILLTYDLSIANRYYPLAKLMLNVLGNEPISPASVRINADDYEEWDYLNPQADLEFQRASKAT
jgi:hypothetical protein